MPSATGRRDPPNGIRDNHKRLLDGDRGLNTGGMGVIAPSPYTAEVAKRCEREIFLLTVAGLAAEGMPFTGCLYFGLMLTADGPKVIEYNCRFGDPETQVVLPLLESDLPDIFEATSAGTLADVPVDFAQGAAARVVMSAEGYPATPRKGDPIDLPADLESSTSLPPASLSGTASY